MPRIQNLSGRLARSTAVFIMMRRKRSYSSPDASEKMWTVSSRAVPAAGAAGAAARAGAAAARVLKP